LAGAIVYLVLVEQIGKSLRVRTILRRVVAFDDAASEFRGLHTSGCFVMPNPFDAGSARALEQLGFKALATTSAGLAWTLGRADNEVTLDESLEHLRVVAGAVKVPVNADFEGGFAIDPEHVAANVKLAAATGIAGLSIEDSTGDERGPLHEFDLAVERVRAADLGVRRISVGGTLARTAWAGFLGAAQELADEGTFSRFEGLPDLDHLFRARQS